jgi:hypothetical protein
VPVAAHLDPIPAHGHLAPDAAAIARPIDEDPAAEGIAAGREACPVVRELDDRRQQLVAEPRPPRRDRPQRALGREAVGRAGKASAQVVRPRRKVPIREADERPCGVSRRPEAPELIRRRQAGRERDVV